MLLLGVGANSSTAGYSYWVGGVVASCILPLSRYSLISAALFGTLNFARIEERTVRNGPSLQTWPFAALRGISIGCEIWITLDTMRCRDDTGSYSAGLEGDRDRSKTVSVVELTSVFSVFSVAAARQS